MHDVVIVGGGPVGLFLACELRLAGIDPLVLEALAAPSTADKAHGIGGQAVRLLDHRGLFERFGGTGIPTPTPTYYFGTLPVPVHVLGADNPMHVLLINQREIESRLLERAAELRVALRREAEVRSISQTPDQVELVVADADGQESRVQARYVVGCDGGHSLIRKASGIGFPGVYDGHVISRTAMIAPTEQIRPASADAHRLGGRIEIDGFGEIGGNFHRTERGVILVSLVDRTHPWITTIEWEDDPDDSYPGPGQPMTLPEMEASVERVLGVRVPLTAPADGEPSLVRRLRGRNTRLADRYRDGRVFLAGDAAHVHAASGGPGLNLGLQDAANLAWKLAADLHGQAPDDLLDTYQTERRALGERVFMQTQSQTALMAPGSDVTQLRNLVSELLTDRTNVQRIADLLAGTDVRYDMGGGDPSAPTGWFVPELEVSIDGSSTRVAELCRSARPILLDLSGDGLCAEATAPWTDRVDIVRGVAKTPPATALLIRPDGYVAWAGDDPQGLPLALRRWFGAPCAVTTQKSVPAA